MPAVSGVVAVAKAEGEEVSPSNNSRETWLHGWPRGRTDVLIGTGVYCVGCGKDHGITTVAFPEWWEHWRENRPYPDWPFDPESCPICYLENQQFGHTERDFIQVGKDGTPVRDLRGKLPK